MADGYQSLTDKEKQTLRLILCGHDAKSMAGALDLSVHTVNERLRNARRKLAVTSSKEAARVLLEAEGEAPQTLVPKPLGDAQAALAAADMALPNSGAPARMSPAATIGGLCIMALILAALALTLSPSLAVQPQDAAAAEQMAASEAEEAAREWLALVEAGDWQASWNGTAQSFRDLNTLEGWTAAAQGAHGPLGESLSRVLESAEEVPAPPQGYTLVKFRTQFANRADVVETLALVQEDGEWRIAGIYIS